MQTPSLLTTFTVCECPLSLIISDTLLLTLINGNSASGMTWELPKKFHIRCISASHGAFPRSPVPQGPSHLLPPAGQLQCRSFLLMRRNSSRPRKVGAQPPSTASTGPSPPTATTSPKMEIKKKRKRKSVKRTATSETVSPQERRKKIVSESPDSQAEGPFCDSDTVSVSEGSPHATQW